MSLIPPPKGWHIAPRNPDGTLKGRISKEERERREAKRKTDMENYFARSNEAQERLVKAAKGIKEKVEAPAPKDELDFVVMNILADPAGHLDGKGSATLRTLTEDQRRSRARARMDEQAAACPVASHRDSSNLGRGSSGHRFTPASVVCRARRRPSLRREVPR